MKLNQEEEFLISFSRVSRLCGQITDVSFILDVHFDAQTASCHGNTTKPTAELDNNENARGASKMPHWARESGSVITSIWVSGKKKKKYQT